MSVSRCRGSTGFCWALSQNGTHDVRRGSTNLPRPSALDLRKAQSTHPVARWDGDLAFFGGASEHRWAKREVAAGVYSARAP